MHGLHGLHRQGVCVAGRASGRAAHLCIEGQRQGGVLLAQRLPLLCHLPVGSQAGGRGCHASERTQAGMKGPLAAAARSMFGSKQLRPCSVHCSRTPTGPCRAEHYAERPAPARKAGHNPAGTGIPVPATRPAQPTALYSGSGTLSRMAPGGERCSAASARQRPSAAATCGHTALPICCSRAGRRWVGGQGRWWVLEAGARAAVMAAGWGADANASPPPCSAPPPPHCAWEPKQHARQPPQLEPASPHLVALGEEGGADEALGARGGARRLGRPRQQDVVVGEALRGGS